MILLDTSALIEISYGTEIGRKIKSIISYQETYIASISVYEYLYSAKSWEIGLNVIENLGVFDFSKKDAIKSIEIEKELSKKGQMINKLNIFIAAVAINKNAILISMDKHFANIKELKSKLF